MAPKKIDLKKELKELYGAPTKEIVQIEVPALWFLMVDGQGDPNTTPEYAEAVEALFSVSYTAKFMIKKGPRKIDYAVMPLEGLWWADDMSVFTSGEKAKWKWTIMIMQPDFVSKETVDAALAEVRKKKDLPGVDRLRYEKFAEGRCAQVMHIGPFSEEGPTIVRLHEFIDARSSRTGKHHEIYLSDIRRANPSRWKTILRQPMK
ncbi:MAG: GyrI-like domain-containing protein [Nibricoccus sp.]